MTTRHTVRVPKRVFRRKWLFLLPGTEWVVTAVEQRGKRETPVYTLECAGNVIEREEWRVRALVEEKRKGVK